MLALLAAPVLWMGVYPKPFTDVMDAPVAELLKHVACQSCLRPLDPAMIDNDGSPSPEIVLPGHGRPDRPVHRSGRSRPSAAAPQRDLLCRC